MNFQEKAAHQELYKKLKEKQKENTKVKQKCDLDFYQCRKEIQSKIYKIGKYLESNYELEFSHFIQTWLALNCSKRTIKLRRDGIYQQYEYPQNFRNLEDYLIKLTLFEDPSPWYWRITEQFRKNLLNMTDIDDILTVMQLTLKGFFQEGNIRVTKTIPLQYDRYQCCFTQQFKQKFVILFEVVVEIYPLFNKLNQFQGTEIKHTMIFYNILSYEHYSEQKVIDVTKRHLDNQSEYHRDKQFQGKANGVYRESYQKELFSDYTYGNYYMQDINVVGKILYTCSEFLYKHRNVTKDKLNQYIYDYEIGAWVCMELDDPQLKKIQLQQWINQFFITFDSILPSGKLIKLLQIPQLNIEMTPQEKNIIGAQGNLLVMGRSGTGKTTCAVLRLFGLQLLYKQRMSNFKIRNKELFDSEGITEDDIDNLGLKCVFVTASPVLANQVKKYYQSLNDKQVSRKYQYNQDENEQSDSPLNEDDKNEEDEEKLMADMNKYDSFDDMSTEDFPAFFTIRQLIQLIDGSLQNPFFSQFKNQQSNGNTQLLSKWHNSNHRIERQNKIQAQLVDSDDDQKMESDDFHKSILNNLKLMSQEVTYEVFEAEFWPTLKIYSQKLKGITPGLLWTHIYSYIKGSALSHSSWKPYLNTWSYYKLKPKLMIKKSMMKQIYELFIQYEEWKTQNNYYDLMDAVNYILIQIKNSNTQFHKIHYLMVDEVQDLPDNVLLLLLRVTQFGTFFSGDTAQNIAKGVGFRFQDLNSLFKQYAYEHDVDELKDDQFQRYQLNINFRSHNNILQLANSIISVLELCFPQTIDILEKEKSNLIGPKPIIIYSQETLFMILNGTEEPLKFGCNQVIIVRDQESKEKIPQILKHALILTIYEAKGLEFNDVILYNFFNDASDQWSILEKLSSETQLVDIEELKNTITLHNQGVDDENIYGYQKIDNKYLIKKIKFQKKSQKFDLQQYSLLCNDLKQLYVAITRTKKRFIIFDDDSSNREGLQNIWNQLQLVDIYHKNDIPQDLQNQIQQTSPQEWQQQGKMLFDNKFYLQSMKCFQLSSDDYYYQKANAYHLAEEATKVYSQISAYEKNSSKIDIEKQYKQLFRNASKLFLQISNPRKAAKCLYSAGDYSEALQIYEEQGWIKEAAEAAKQCRLFLKAGDLFFQINDFTNALDAYENALDQEGLYKTLSELKKLFDPNIQIYIKKYLVLVLSNIQDKLVEGVDKKEPFINQQKEHIKSINEIDEYSKYSILNYFYFNTSQDQSMEQFNTIQIDQQNITQQYSEQIQLIPYNEDDLSIISEDCVKNSELNQNQSDSFMTGFQNNFDGAYDQNESLKLERNSSIVSIKSPIITDFSIISQNKINDPVIQLVETRCKIQDQLQLIIKWISISEEFKSLVYRKNKIYIEDAGEFQSDLDEMDLDFVDLMLNILEQFQFFKLCIFVSIRYKLTNKLSRFIILISAQNSPIMMNPSEILRGRQIDLIKYKQIGIEASKDIHSVLCNVPKDLLQQDVLQNQLLIQLIMLGYWKQTAQQLPFDDALSIFRVFQDFKNWKNLYFKSVIAQLKIQLNSEQDKLKRNNIQGKLLVCQKKQLICLNSHPQDLFYFDSPNDEQEKLFTINSLEHIYVELNRENNSLIKIKLPQFLINTEILWNSIQQDKEIPESVSVQVCSNFNNYTQQYLLQESILFMITYVKYVYHNQNSTISQQYQNEYSNKIIILIRDCLQLIINSIKTNIQTQKEQIMLDSIFILNKIRLPKGDLFKHFQEYLLVRRDSKILEKLIKKKQNQIQNCHFIDLDFEFLIAPKDAIIQIKLKLFKLQVQSLFSLRQSYSNKDRDQIIESLGTIISNRFNNIQDAQYSANNQSYLVQNNVKLLLNYEENYSINGFLDEFIAQIMNTNNSYKIEPTVRVKLMEIALTQLSQSKSRISESHNSIIKGIILLNFAQKNHYSYLLIDQISQINHEFKQYHKYLEYLVCRKYNIISDASECYFEYYDTFKQILNVDEILNDLSYLFVHQLISLKQQVYLPQLLINYINQPILSIKKPIYPLSNQNHINFTIQCLIESFDQLIIFAPQQILLILTSFVLNIDVIPIQIITQLGNLRNKQVQLIVENVKYSPSLRMQNLCPNLLFKFLNNQQLFEIQVENIMDFKQLQNNYQDCMKEWEFIASQKQNLTQKANKIGESWKLQKQKRFNNISEGIRNYAHDETKVKQKIKSIRMTLIEMMYKLRLGVEFPVIYQKLEELYQKENQYIKILKDHYNNKIEKQVLQPLTKQMNELNLFDNQICQWRSKFNEKQSKIN